MTKLIAAQQLEVSHPVTTVSKACLEKLALDPDVQDWLISISHVEHTRATYLDFFGRFCKWTGWAPGEMIALKREAMRQGEPISDVERQIKRFHESMRLMGYAGKSRSKAVAAIYSFIQSKGYTVPKRLVRLDMSDMMEMRVPEREEVELFVQYANGLERKLIYTMMTDSPCRPRVFPEIRWNWLEQEWWTKDVAHVMLPKQLRPGGQSGPKKFEPICFLGPKTIALLKQLRESKIKAGRIPQETDRILRGGYEAILVAIRLKRGNHFAKTRTISKKSVSEHDARLSYI